MGLYDNKVALVTGGTSGIGRAAAIAFAREGAKIAITGRREKEGEETVRLVKKVGGEAIFIKADVSREADNKMMVEKTVQAFGRLDAAFNNAGYEGKMAPVTEQTEENYMAIMEPNVKGVLFSMKYEIPAMLKNGGGAIVNNASIAGVLGFAGGSVYVASKHAVIGLTKSAALEMAKSGIRVNAVSPAAIETDMFERFTGDEESKKALAGMHPIGRIGRAEEIADSVVYLCSSRASFITGQSLGVDGGYTAQ